MIYVGLLGAAHGENRCCVRLWKPDRLVCRPVAMGAGLCILSSPPSEGHLAFVVYIPNGGVLHGLQASRVLLLALHCVHIPCPTGDLVISRANHGCIRCSLILDTC